MSKGQLIEWAKDAGCTFPLRSGYGDCRVPQFFSVEGLERFANLVRNAAQKEFEEELKSLQTENARLIRENIQAATKTLDFMLRKDLSNDHK